MVEHGHSHHVPDAKTTTQAASTFFHVHRKTFMIAIALLTTVYSITEIVIALNINSLALFGDGIHNASDVLTLGVAFWADRVSNKFYKH